MDSTKLAEINRTNADKALSDKRHQELFTSTAQVSDTILSATASLVRYLEGHTTKTMVVNQLKNIGTPDAMKVVAAVNDLHTTLKTHENVDLTPVITVMQLVLDEVKAIPKDHPTIEKTESVEVSNQVDNTKQLQSIEKAVKALKLHVEAPKVDVAAPDLSSIIKPIQGIVEAVRAKEVTPPAYDKTVKLKDGSVPTTQTNILVSEDFDEYRIVWVEKFDDSEEDVVNRIDYYNSGKKVASIQYSYDDNGRLTKGKKL